MGAFAGCSGPQPPHDSADSSNAPAASPFRVTTSIQDIMGHQIEPAAEALWNSVSTTISAEGVDEKRPQSDKEWFALRSHAITLMEATNLLVVDGRQVLLPGQTMADEGVQGVLPATEVQAKIDANRAQFVQFSHLLHRVSADMLKAIDAKNIQGMLDAGEAIDAACESCHMTFWYPNQVIPEFPR
jgi:hypothetical protein